MNEEEFVAYFVIGLVLLIIVAKVPGVWDVVKSISAVFKKIFETVFLSLLEWIIFLFKIVWKSHQKFLYNLFTPREIVLPKEKFEQVNKRGVAREES